MSSLKPITLYGHAGPNPWKVVMILEELGVPYETENVDFSAVKQEPYTLLNPNGRVPTVVDPNTNITLWESGAIIEYLIETYDKEERLSISSFPEKHHLRQFLHFQGTGQGPYFGQAVWFAKYHPEDLPSAKERYVEQTVRVLSVLDKLLEAKEYLVGDKCTYADIAFVNWNAAAENVILKPDWDEKVEKKYPNFVAWHRRVTERPIIKDVLQRQAAGR
ncbi:glutathione S-transferase II [Verticillium alfalfae VaMs.102]|uniref:Glutathione S-transferase II n=1 Tax=Verticillium alfalfae (strain VaMs.102 / ATCC MYA-4576 / FGSC 10136) TaxID=526221 RepID=C9SJC8_VERA1|nr:glutathione S-transferase II [Verticillium alfalfae VaMs.102]EEY18290.1 glutathione S-transferase II [Verticillium alfalfae VaMs.102]